LILRDFHCGVCDLAFEDYVRSGEQTAACPSCSAQSPAILSVSHLGTFSSASPKAKAEMLRKRSHDDTFRQLKKEPEKHGFLADDKRRWNIRSQKP